MTIETIMASTLNPLFDGRVYESGTPDEIARDETGAFLPFAIWNIMGGTEQEYVDQTRSNKVHRRIQIATFAHDGELASALLREAGARLLSSEYSVGVYGSPVGTYDAARKLRGRFQQFSIQHPA